MGELINLNPWGIPDEIARDSEILAAIATHIAETDPHPQYLIEGNTTESTSPTTGGIKHPGGLGVEKNVFVGGKLAPYANPASNWGIDFATGGSTIALPSNGTFDLATGSGLVAFFDEIDGSFAAVITYAGGVATIAAGGSHVGGAPPADKVGIYYEPTILKYRIQNRRTTTRNLVISTIKMRATS